MSERKEIEFDELSEEKKKEFEELVGHYQNSLQTIRQFILGNNLDYDETWNIIIYQYLTKK